MEINGQFAELFDKALAGTLDWSDRAQLNILLREQPELRKVYLEQMRLHCLLESRFNAGSDALIKKSDWGRQALKLAAGLIGVFFFAFGVYATVRALSKQFEQNDLESSVLTTGSEIINGVAVQSVDDAALDLALAGVEPGYYDEGDALSDAGGQSTETSEIIQRVQLLSAMATLGMGAVLPQNVPATDYMWMGAGDEPAWENHGNWMPGSGYPGMSAGDTASITMDADITLLDNYSFKSFYKNGSSDVDAPAMIYLTGGGLTLEQKGSIFEVGAKYTDLKASSVRAAKMFVDGSDICIGSPEQPAILAVSYLRESKNSSSQGWYAQTGGSFIVCLSALFVGNCQVDETSVPVQGSLDLRGVDNVDITVEGPLSIHGNREVSLGELLLGERANLTGGSRTAPAPESYFYHGYLDGSTRGGFHGTSEFSIVSGNLDLRYDIMRFGVEEASDAGRVLGTLKSTTYLGPDTKVKLEANQLHIGTGGSNYALAEALFDASKTTDGELTVYDKLVIGTGRTTRFAEVLLGTNWAVNIGTPQQPATTFAIASQSSFYAWQTNHAVVSMQGGSFIAYATNLQVGVVWKGGSATHREQSARLQLSNMSAVKIVADVVSVGWYNWDYSIPLSMIGTLDMQGSTNITIDVGTFRIGAMLDERDPIGYGSVYLGEGNGVVGNLVVATPKAAQKGLHGSLTLDGMRLSVMDALTIGNRGSVTTLVNKASAGLVLANTLQDKTIATENWYGTNTIVFNTSPKARRGWTIRPSTNLGVETSIWWGFAWQGNHIEDIKELWNRDGGSGKIQVIDNLMDDFAGRVDVFFDGSVTYIGFPYLESPATRIELW